MSKLSSLELRSALTLACVISLRLFGLFLIMPVFSLYAKAMPDATGFMIGLALGVYGIGQVLLQIPLGLLSDRIGRKPAITIGLVLFAIGGLIAAMSHTLAGIAVGRAVQGMGAVAGAGIALAADLTAEENRSKAMGIIGVSIGLAFLLALILGPPLEAVAGLPGLFGATSILALASLALLWLIVPTPAHARAPAAAGLGQVLAMLRDGRMLVLNGSVFFLHALLTASFVGLPLLLADTLHLPVNRHWELYLPVMTVAAFVMGATMHHMREVAQSLRIVTVCVVVIGLALLGFALSGRHLAAFGVAAAVFFSAFNLLEAALPSLVSRLAPEQLRGAAMGAYSTSQFIGAFVGGALGGIALGRLGPNGVFVCAAALTLLWLPLVVSGARRITRRAATTQARLA
ncbi:MFS transporter [Rhodanobacter thiooxydans]|uniref:MFS transporter n=1 Tax=Rhodanobacter thiooxydans TaxID=416169 RepID=A0A154QLE6_9GAMM|nr:MFS transporter [Rhodanobacter thiooxydans]EIM01492.1 arabinose efflux permease family protein [Rhodanobacter thiooxydans LCS2]KZC25035.1 MFS transporter [Rhodanobacter thiooxydans]MCW0202253.1 MFS transporter [Rhodanobacter thiooxydans]